VTHGGTIINKNIMPATSLLHLPHRNIDRGQNTNSGTHDGAMINNTIAPLHNFSQHRPS